MTIGSAIRSSTGARCSRSAPCSTTARVAGSERALAAAGPGLTVVYHAMYEGDPASVDALPGGVEWRKRARDSSPRASAISQSTRITWCA